MVVFGLIGSCSLFAACSDTSSEDKKRRPLEENELQHSDQERLKAFGQDIEIGLLPEIPLQLPDPDLVWDEEQVLYVNSEYFETFEALTIPLFDEQRLLEFDMILNDDGFTLEQSLIADVRYILVVQVDEKQSFIPDQDRFERQFVTPAMHGIVYGYDLFADEYMGMAHIEADCGTPVEHDRYEGFNEYDSDYAKHSYAEFGKDLSEKIKVSIHQAVLHPHQPS